MSINEMVAEEDNYGDLADDVLGENGDEDTKEKKDAFDMFDPFGGEDSDNSDDDTPNPPFGSFGGGGKGRKKTGSGEEKLDKNSKTYAPYLSFDFRRMKKQRWPEGCELLLPETREEVDKAAKELLKTTLIAEERFKSMARRGGVSSSDLSSRVGSWDDVQKNRGTGTAMGPANHVSYGSIDYMELLGGSDSDSDQDQSNPKKIYTEKDLASPAPQGAKFETLGDGSTALIMEEGCRLRLDLSDLVDDAWKKRADIKVEDTGKNRVGAAAQGGGESKYSSSTYMRKRKLKEPINEYTVTMDIKLIEDVMPPANGNGVALLSTKLYYVHEDIKKKLKKIKASDSELQLNSKGGIGKFGQYGDTARVRLTPARWHRVVVTVRCKDPPKKKKTKKSGHFGQRAPSTNDWGDDSFGGGGGKKNNTKNAGGEMRTYIDTKPCCTISGDAVAAQWFKKNGRFALDAKALYLFSSGNEAMMPGSIAVRYVRVSSKFSSPEDVKSMRARDKIISMYNENVKDTIDQQRKGLVLSALFAKPRPMWMDPSLVGLFGDAYIQGTTLEGSSAMPFSFMSICLAMKRMVEVPSNRAHSGGGGSLDMLYGMSSDDRAKVTNVLHVMEYSENIFMMVQRLLKYNNAGQLMWFLRKLRKQLRALQPGNALLVPCFAEGSEMLLFVQRKQNQSYFRFVVISTNPKGGLRHHDVSAAEGPGFSKLKYRASMVLDFVPKHNALDDVFWMALFNMAIKPSKGDCHKFYDVLLPFLIGKPLEEAIVSAEKAEDNWKKGDNQDCGSFGDWRSPERSATSYVTVVGWLVGWLVVGGWLVGWLVGWWCCW
jgi:hypothetical protein